MSQPTNKNRVPSEIHRLLAAELDRSEEVVLHGIDLGVAIGKTIRPDMTDVLVMIVDAAVG